MSVRTGTVRVCHLSDVHLGYRRYHRLTPEGFNRREADVADAFRRVVSAIAERRPDVVVIAGDLFHSVRPSNATVTAAFRELKRLRAASGAPVVIAAGNHETPRRSDTGSLLRLFREIEGVHVADSETKTFVFPGVAVTACPHASLARSREPLVRPAGTGRSVHVLVTHAQTGGAWITDAGGAAVDEGVLKPEQWDYVALGHVHTARQVWPNTCYSGSTEFTSNDPWSEAGSPKGFLEVTLPGPEVRFVEVPGAREHLDLPAVDAEGLSAAALSAEIASRVAAVPGGIAGKVVRLVLTGASRDALRGSDHAALRRFRAEALAFVLDPRSPAAPRRAAAAIGAAGAGVAEGLREFALAAGPVDSVPAARIAGLLEQYLVREAEEAERRSAAGTEG